MSGSQPNVLAGKTDMSLGLYLGASSAGVSLFGSLAANKALSKQADAANKAAQVRIDTQSRAFQIDQIKRRNRAELIRARIRLLGSSSGTGVGGSIAALDRQALLDQAFNSEIARANLRAANTETKSKLAAVLAGIDSKKRVPFADALVSGAQGFATGLSLQQGIDQRNALRDFRASQPIVDNSLTSFMNSQQTGISIGPPPTAIDPRFFP